MSSPLSGAERWRSVCATIAGLVCASIGLVVLAGWNLHVPLLIRVFPRFGTMQPNAAVGLVLCGLSLLAFLGSQQRLGGALAWLAALLGLLTIAEHTLGWDLRIDTLFVRSWPDRNGLPLTRMGPAAALCHFLAGCALATLHRSTSESRDLLLVEILAALVAAFGLAGAVNFAFHLDAVEEWRSSTGMALRTCGAFLCLGFALLLLAGRHRSTARERWMHLWLPFLVALVVASASWLLWGALFSEGRVWSRQRLDLEAPFVRESILKDGRNLVSYLTFVAADWARAGPPADEQRSRESRQNDDSPSSLVGIGWADDLLRIRWIAPRVGTELLAGRSLGEESLFPGGIRLTVESKPIAVSRATEVGTSGKAFLAVLPVAGGEAAGGFVVGVVNVERFFGSAVADPIALGCTISIFDGEAEVFRRPGARATPGPSGAGILPIPIHEGWTCRIGAVEETQSSSTSTLSSAVLVVGHLLAVLLAATVAFAQTAQRRSAALLDANRRLESEMAERLRADDSLRKAHDELEARVLARTAELSSANAELKKEVVERQQVEKEREALLIELEAEKTRLAVADRRKTEFLAILGHELRNPLSPILNTLTLIRGRGSDTSWKEGEQEILERQVRQLARLVDDLLDLSRITRGQIALHKERVDLANIVRGGAEAVRSLVESRKIALEIELPAEPLEAMVDPARIEQALDNLLHNATKFTEPGGRISIHATRSGDEAILCVRDTGSGLEPDALQSIFEPFTRANKSRTKARSGLGIGLTLVKSFVDLHGGGVIARSEGLGRGSEFQMRLPLLPRSVEPGFEGPSTPPSFDPGPRAVSHRVYVVDDNVDAAKTLEVLMKSWGHDVAVAHDGETALEAIPRYGPSFILLDLELPGVSGYEVAQRLRQDGLTSLKIIALTGYGQEDDRRRTLDAGIDLHLVKPVEPAVLQRLLAEGA